MLFLRLMISLAGLVTPTVSIQIMGHSSVPKEFDNYMSSKGIKHYLITAYRLAANSTIERFFRNLKKCL